MELTMRFITVLLTALISIVLASPAAAQVESGRHEVGVKGSFDRGNHEFEARVTRIDFDGSYGTFITDRFEIGPTFTYSKLGEDDANWAISGFLSVHLADTSSKAVPYIATSYGQIFGDDRYFADPTFATVGSGVKWFFGDGGGALDFSAFYRHQFFDVGGAPNFATGVNELGAKVGVAIYFGR
jgi:hypothetical protein